MATIPPCCSGRGLDPTRRLSPVATITDHLQRIGIFTGCSSSDLALLARAADELSLPSGTELTRQGDIGREAFVLLTGRAEVRRDGTTVAQLGPGDVVGELSLLDGGPRSATVVAGTDLDVLVLSRPAFHAVLDEIPTLAHRLLVTLARRLRAAEDQSHLD